MAGLPLAERPRSVWPGCARLLVAEHPVDGKCADGRRRAVPGLRASLLRLLMSQKVIAASRSLPSHKSFSGRKEAHEAKKGALLCPGGKSHLTRDITGFLATNGHLQCEFRGR